MMNNEEQQVIALAATIQALTNVHTIATEGRFDQYSAASVLQGLVSYNPSDTLSAYGGDVSALSQGLQQLQQLFSDTLNRDIAQYLLAVVTIELKLVRQPHMRRILQTKLHAIIDDIHATATSSPTHQVTGFNEVFDEAFDEAFDSTKDDSEENDSAYQTHLEKEASEQREETPLHEKLPLHEKIVEDTTLAQFADVYKQTASQTEPRIMIKGQHQNLQNELSANRIRALLLAALRAAAFYRHYGGKRIDFMLKRKQFLEIARRLR